MRWKATRARLNSLEATKKSRIGKPSIDEREIAIVKTATVTKETIAAAAEVAAEEEEIADEVGASSVTRATNARAKSLVLLLY